MTVAFVPSYVLPGPIDYKNSSCAQSFTLILMGLVALSLIFNLITLRILNSVAVVKEMGSF